ncbi:MAG: amidohydrolase family protein [Methanomassiliicoccales archaeon]
MRTLIKGAWVVTQDVNRSIVKADVLVDKGRIAAVGDVREEADEIVEAAGDILMPGLINTHGHVAMSIMKGVADDVPFPVFLDKVFALDSGRQRGDMLTGASLGCLEMIRSGTTTFVDLYYDEDVIAEAVQAAGLRALLCWCVLDVEYTTQKGVPLDNCRHFCQKFKEAGRIMPGVGLQGVYVCSEETFLGARELSDRERLPMTFHLSETRGEVNDHKQKYGKRPADWLDSIGFLNHRCIAAHSAWLTIAEVRALARNQVSVSTCPVSNMKLATGGVAPIPEMLANGVNVSIGTDGSTTNNSLDMFGEMKMLALLQKSSRWDASVVNAQQALDFATLGGAQALGMRGELGSIEVGKKADLVLLDGRSPNLRPLFTNNVVSNIVYSANAGNVKSVMVDGRFLMRDRSIFTLDEAAILAESEAAMASLMKK